MSVKVEIYTKTFCPYCERAKELLRIKGVPFIEHTVSDNPDLAAELRRRGATDTVPGVFIDGRLIGSCAELFELDENGSLDRLLASTP